MLRELGTPRPKKNFKDIYIIYIFLITKFLLITEVCAFLYPWAS